MKTTIVALFLLVPVLAAAQGTPSTSPAWYEYAAGVLAIPAAIIGIAYSYVLIQKTRIDTRKLKLEVMEKESQIKSTTSSSLSGNGSVIYGEIKDSVVFNIILRFVLLYVTLSLFSVATGIVISIVRTVGFGGIVYEMLRLLIDLARWGIVLSLGWPLMKDINKYLGANRSHEL